MEKFRRNNDFFFQKRDKIFYIFGCIESVAFCVFVYCIQNDLFYQFKIIAEIFAILKIHFINHYERNQIR